jgi:hypothetical protein
LTEHAPRRIHKPHIHIPIDGAAYRNAAAVRRKRDAGLPAFVDHSDTLDFLSVSIEPCELAFVRIRRMINDGPCHRSRHCCNVEARIRRHILGDQGEFLKCKVIHIEWLREHAAAEEKQLAHRINGGNVRIEDASRLRIVQVSYVDGASFNTAILPPEQEMMTIRKKPWEPVRPLLSF